MRSRACLAFVAFSLLGSACAKSHTVAWSIGYPGGSPPANAYLVHSEVKTACGAAGAFLAFDDSYDGMVRHGGEATVLATGSYGLYVEVRDRMCNILASGCVPFSIPASSPILVTLATTSGPACDTSMCMNGYCGPTMLTDLGMDAGPPPTDMPTDAPIVDMVVPPVDMPGTCTGCMMGASCVTGAAQHACGMGGGMCSDCGDLTMECVGGACVHRPDHLALSPLTSFLISSGSVYSAGDDAHMQRGTRMAVSPAGSFERMTPAPSGSAAAIGATQFATCAVDSATGTLSCWGSNASGLLGRSSGDGTLVDAVPRPVTGTGHWSSVSGGNQHFCGIQTDGSLWCWGDGTSGKLGNGALAAVNAPAHIGTATWLVVSAGYSHTCAVKSDHTLWCWGSNDKGQLGNGTTADAMVPSQVGTSADWSTVAASNGGSHSCGIRAPGNLFCWGDTTSGKLGLGDPAALGATVTSPMQVGSDSTWTRISAGQFHTCGVNSLGQGLCWGFGGFGELGTGTTSQQNMPTLVVGSWADVAASWHWSCGVQTSGGPQCWGDNRKGQLGIGDTGDPDGGVQFLSSPTSIMPGGL